MVGTRAHRARVDRDTATHLLGGAPAVSRLAYGCLLRIHLRARAAIGAALSLMRRRGYLPLVIVLSFMVATIAISVVALDSRLQLSTVFGDSPVVAGRFSGVNNVTFSQLMIGALLLAVFVAGLRPRVALAAVGALFIAVALVDGAPMWGADVGGVLAGIPAFALAFTLLAGWRVRVRTVFWWVLGHDRRRRRARPARPPRDASHRTTSVGCSNASVIKVPGASPRS